MPERMDTFLFKEGNEHQESLDRKARKLLSVWHHVFTNNAVQRAPKLKSSHTNWIWMAEPRGDPDVP